MPMLRHDGTRRRLSKAGYAPRAGGSKPASLDPRLQTVPSLGRLATRIEAGEFDAEVAGERVHTGAAGASFSVGVVVGVGVDVVGVDRTFRVGDELDAGDTDRVGR